MFNRDIEYREVDSTKTVPIAEEIHKEIRHIKADKNRPIKEIVDKLIRESLTLQQRLSEGDQTGLENLEDGTELRHRYSTGEYDGSIVKATIFDGKIVYGGDAFENPSPAAIQADKDIRGDDGLDNRNGWRFWKFEDGEGEWVKIDAVR